MELPYGDIRFFYLYRKNKHFKRIYGQIRGQNWYDFI